MGLILISCKSSKSLASPAEIEALSQLIKQQDFRIESDWAYPQTTNALQQVLNAGLLMPGSTPNSINLIGNPNFLEISGDSITSYLPYFGERQMQIDYAGKDSAIQLSGIIENYEVKAGKKDSYIITFNAHTENERFWITLRVFPNLKTSVNLNGNGRFPISYSGSIIEKPME